MQKVRPSKQQTGWTTDKRIKIMQTHTRIIWRLPRDTILPPAMLLFHSQSHVIAYARTFSLHDVWCHAYYMILPSSLSLHRIASHYRTQKNMSSHQYANVKILSARVCFLGLPWSKWRWRQNCKNRMHVLVYCTGNWNVSINRYVKKPIWMKMLFLKTCLFCFYFTKIYFPFELKNHIIVIITIAIISNGSASQSMDCVNERHWPMLGKPFSAFFCFIFLYAVRAYFVAVGIFKSYLIEYYWISFGHFSIHIRYHRWNASSTFSAFQFTSYI